VDDSSSQQRSFTFDGIYAHGRHGDHELGTRSIWFGSVRPAVDRVMDGMNAAVMTYGQTSSGKTRLLFGRPLFGKRSEVVGTPLSVVPTFADSDTNMPMIERSLRHIFASLEHVHAGGGTSLVRLGYLTLCNEDLTDELNQSFSPALGGRSGCMLRETRSGGPSSQSIIYVDDQRLIVVRDVDHALAVLERADKGRSMSHNPLSRMSMVVNIYVDQQLPLTAAVASVPVSPSNTTTTTTVSATTNGQNDSKESKGPTVVPSTVPPLSSWITSSCSLLSALKTSSTPTIPPTDSIICRSAVLSLV
jgi:hypothetical protein